MLKVFISAGLILAALTGYAQWTWQNPLPQGNDLSTVFFVNSQIGYNVGNCGTIVKTITGPLTIIDVSHLTAGVYLVRLENDRTVKVAKIIKL